MVMVGGAAIGGALLGGMVVRSAVARGLDVDEFTLDMCITMSATAGVGAADVYSEVMERASQEGQKATRDYINNQLTD